MLELARRSSSGAKEQQLIRSAFLHNIRVSLEGISITFAKLLCHQMAHQLIIRQRNLRQLEFGERKKRRSSKGITVLLQAMDEEE